MSRGGGVMLLASLLALASCARGKGPTAAELSHPLVGKPGPTFGAVRVGGGAFDLTAERGHLVVVFFWATWCDPCRKAFPQLAKLAEKYRDQITIVGVSEDDDPNGIEEFVAIYDGTFDVVWDEGKQFAGKWQPKAMPASFVVDAGGVVRFVHLGYDDGEDAEIEKELKTLL
jgi:cytochrome c biogenesis protein CcmG, thiol:disulfide interchange protein DsbE